MQQPRQQQQQRRPEWRASHERGSPMFEPLRSEFNRYREYVRNHPENVKRVEEMMRFAILLAPTSSFGPERSEIISETSFAFLGLLGVSNDYLIHNGRTKDEHVYDEQMMHRIRSVQSRDQSHPRDPQTQPLPVPSSWLLFKSIPEQRQAKLMRVVRVILTLMAHSQVMMELIAARFGEAMRWRLVILVEFAKSALRGLLLALDPRLILRAGGQYESHIAAASTDSEANGTNNNNGANRSTNNSSSSPSDEQQGGPNSSRQGSSSSGSGSGSGSGRRLGDASENDDTDNQQGQQSQTPQQWRGRRSGRTLPISGNAARYANMQGIATTSLDASGNSSDNAAQLSPQRRLEIARLQLLGELLHIARPMVYVLLLVRARRKSWYPWLTSLGIDVLSLYLTNSAVNPTLSTFPESERKSLEEEIAKRQRSLIYYLMRSPAYDNTLLRMTDGLTRSTENIPLIGSLGGFLAGTLEYYHKTHFYISAS